MMFVARIREDFPGVEVTETHPKALFAAKPAEWKRHFQALASLTDITLHDPLDDRRDALISALAAREGFEGRWKKDLIDERFEAEQDPSNHWLAPVHYFWPA
jgi:predicted nuclease with RNAse H fold